MFSFGPFLNCQRVELTTTDPKNNALIKVFIFLHTSLVKGWPMKLPILFCLPYYKYDNNEHAFCL